MEEQILKIIDDEIELSLTDSYKAAFIDGTNNATQKITSHVLEFIAWLRENCDTGNGYWDIGDLTEYYDEDIYQYWLINIKDK